MPASAARRPLVPPRPPHPRRRRAATRTATALVLAAAVAITTAACGGGNGGDDGAKTVTGRVMTLDATHYCVSPDRGETQTCVDIPNGDARAVQGVDVGECVTTTPDLTSEGSFVKVVDDARCAAGDLGEPAGD